MFNIETPVLCYESTATYLDGSPAGYVLGLYRPEADVPRYLFFSDLREAATFARYAGAAIALEPTLRPRRLAAESYVRRAMSHLDVPAGLEADCPTVTNIRRAS